MGIFRQRCGSLSIPGHIGLRKVPMSLESDFVSDRLGSSDHCFGFDPV